VKSIVDRMHSIGNSKVCDKISNAADIHSYRSDYCTAIYNLNARDIANIERSERYCCRGD